MLSERRNNKRLMATEMIKIKIQFWGGCVGTWLGTEAFPGVFERLLRTYIFSECGRAFQSLGAEVERSPKRDCVFMHSDSVMCIILHLKLRAHVELVKVVHFSNADSLSVQRSAGWNNLCCKHEQNRCFEPPFRTDFCVCEVQVQKPACSLWTVWCLSHLWMICHCRNLCVLHEHHDLNAPRIPHAADLTPDASHQCLWHLFPFLLHQLWQCLRYPHCQPQAGKALLTACCECRCSFLMHAAVYSCMYLPYLLAGWLFLAG